MTPLRFYRSVVLRRYSLFFFFTDTASTYIYTLSLHDALPISIQVVTAQTSARPTLVFDEVDVGIGGATGDVVGRLLRELGKRSQVICVTHLAQVASKGHQHLQVTKTASSSSAQSTLIELTGEAKVEEIARMLGGMTITDQSLAHAREFLEK